MDMLDLYGLFALAPFPRQGFDLHGVGAHEFGRQVAEYVQPFNALPSTYVQRRQRVYGRPIRARQYS
jgi:hypothetical protein